MTHNNLRAYDHYEISLRLDREEKGIRYTFRWTVISSSKNLMSLPIGKNRKKSIELQNYHIQFNGKQSLTFGNLFTDKLDLRCAKTGDI